jgi:hypothetical protein
VSQPQYIEALERANEVRVARADVKHRVFRGELSIADALRLECCQAMTVFELVCSQYRVGLVSARRMLRELRVSEWRKVGDLSERQRQILVGLCEAKRKAA